MISQLCTWAVSSPPWQRSGGCTGRARHRAPNALLVTRPPYSQITALSHEVGDHRKWRSTYKAIDKGRRFSQQNADPSRAVPKILLPPSLSLPRNRGVSSFQGNLQLARGADSFGWTWELTRLPIYERTTPPLLRPNFSHWQPNWFNWTTRIFQFVARSRGTQRVAKRTSVSPPQAIDFPGAKL